MPFHHTDPRHYPGAWDPRPKLSVPPEALRLAVGEKSEDFLEVFYNTFRHREKWDNFHSEEKTYPASLADIYECFVSEYSKTVKDMVEKRIVMPERHFSRVKGSPMTWRSFNNFLHDYDERYMAGPPSPPRSRSDSIDMLPLWNKYDGWGDIRPFISKPNPVLTIDRSHHVKKELVDSVMEKLQAD